MTRYPNCHVCGAKHNTLHEYWCNQILPSPKLLGFDHPSRTLAYCVYMYGPKHPVAIAREAARQLFWWRMKAPLRWPSRIRRQLRNFCLFMAEKLDPSL